MRDISGAESRVRALRQAFDRSFASPPVLAAREVEDLLSVRIAGDPYAIRLGDITGIVGRRTIVTVPSAAPGLLGLAGIRGDLVPVFGLSSLLGYGHEVDSPNWLVLCGAEEPIALGFSGFEGYLRLAKSALHVDETHQSARVYVDQIAATDAGALPVLGIRLVVATIRNRFAQSPSKKEQ